MGNEEKKSINLISKEQGDEGKTNRPSFSRQEKTLQAALLHQWSGQEKQSASCAGSQGRGDKKGKKPLLIHPEAASENTACILHIYRQTAEKDRISKKSQAKKLSESDKKTNRIAEERQKGKNKQLKGRKVNKTDVKLTASHIVANRSKQA